MILFVFITTSLLETLFVPRMKSNICYDIWYIQSFEKKKEGCVRCVRYCLCVCCVRHFLHGDTVITRPGFEIPGPVPIVDHLDPESARARHQASEAGDWTEIPLTDIGIAWTPSDRMREREVTIEGVSVRVVTREGIAEPSAYLLSDLIYVVEERDAALRRERAGKPGKSAQNTQVELSAEFIARHGPLWLCGDHGLPTSHLPDCDLMWKRERVSHIVRLAQQCRAAVEAASLLRAGRPIKEEHHALLPLGPAAFPPLPGALVHTADLKRLRERLADPLVDEWRRLEAWFDRLKEWSESSPGVFPALVRQLAADCRRDGQHRACKNPQCSNDFVPTTRQERYCGKPACEQSRQSQRFAKLAKCPGCKRRLSAKLEACRYCGTELKTP